MFANDILGFWTCQNLFASPVGFQTTFLDFGHVKTYFGKSLKLMKICFFPTWKRCASRFCEGSTERQLQIIDMELFGANCVFGNL